MTAYIYGLTNPLRDNEIFYIGQAADCEKRLYQHLNSSRIGKTLKDEIIRSILATSKIPNFKVLETIEGEDYYQFLHDIAAAELKWAENLTEKLEGNEFVAFSNTCRICGEMFGVVNQNQSACGKCKPRPENTIPIGRKSLGDNKIPITVYVQESIITCLGGGVLEKGKDVARVAAAGAIYREKSIKDNS